MVVELRDYSTKKGKESKDMIAELKECPYCGGDAELYVYSTGRDKNFYLVRCENCGNGTCADDDVYTVMRLWNVRTSNDEEENVKTIYISLPAKGLSDDEKYNLQKSLAEEASDYLDAITELREPCVEAGSNEFETLAARFKSIGEAEYVIFPDGWELLRECRIEYETAKEYSKKILIEHGNKLQEEL